MHQTGLPLLFCPITYRTAVTSSISGENPPIQTNMNCQSKHTVYIISCRRCGIKHVGVSNQTVEECYRKHRKEFIHNNPNSLYKHFRQYNHGLEDLKITLIQKIAEIENDEKLLRQWTNLLRTNYPYRFNRTLP